MRLRARRRDRLACGAGVLGASVAIFCPATLRAQDTLAPAPEAARPIHETSRIAAMVHFGIPNDAHVSAEGNGVDNPEVSVGVGIALALDVPLSEHLGFVTSARFTNWVPRWEQKAGFSDFALYDATLAPKYADTVGFHQRAQWYVQIPIGAGVSAAPDPQFDTMSVSIDTRPVLTYGIAGGFEVLFGEAPIGLVVELGARYYDFTHEFTYTPVDRASFDVSREEVEYSFSWWYAQLGLMTEL